jgi:hypothetical protein
MFCARINKMGLAMCMAAVALVWAGAAPPAEDKDPSAVSRERGKELRTMASVLTEVLSREDLDAGWAGLSSGVPSPFEQQRIKSEYIPTVGAIFTIPVGFPLVDHAKKAPEKAKGKESEEKKDVDLWIKHWEGRPESAAAPGAPGASTASPASQAYTYTIVRNVTTVGPGEQIAFDKEKVAKLRRALIDTLARYGSRMAHVAEMERVLLIVESPADTSELLSTGPFTYSVGAVGPGGSGFGRVFGPEDPKSLDLMSPDGTAVEYSTGLSTSLSPESAAAAGDSELPAQQPQEAGEKARQTGQKAREAGEKARQAGEKARQAGEKAVQAAEKADRNVVERNVVSRSAPDNVRSGFLSRTTAMAWPGGDNMDRYLIAVNKSDLKDKAKFEDLDKTVNEKWY